MVPITKNMGLQEAEPMTQLIDAAQRLRNVRAAYRRFLLLWALEKESHFEKPGRPRTKRGTEKFRNLRQLRFFDDL